MQRSLAILTIACCGLWLQMASLGMAQNRDAFGPAAPQGRDAYNRPTYANATVSPYLNLGVYPNGLSSYQTLVKPMIDQREALRLQMDDRQQPRQHARDARDLKNPRVSDSSSSTQPVVRFMHYSHFYGGLR
jgi:hypothetical protein